MSPTANCILENISPFSSVQSLSRVWLFVTPWTAARQASLPITNSWSLPKPMSIESVMPSNLSSSFFSCPQSFPASGSFPMSQLFASGGPSTGASALASVLPMNSQDWFSLGLTGLISFQSKGLSRRVFSNTTVGLANDQGFLSFSLWKVFQCAVSQSRCEWPSGCCFTVWSQMHANLLVI